MYHSKKLVSKEKNGIEGKFGIEGKKTRIEGKKLVSNEKIGIEGKYFYFFIFLYLLFFRNYINKLIFYIRITFFLHTE